MSLGVGDLHVGPGSRSEALNRAEYVPAITAMEAARFATLPRMSRRSTPTQCTDSRSPTISPTASKRRSGGNQRRTWIHESEQPARRSRRCRQNSLSLESLSFVATSNQACGPASTADLLALDSVDYGYRVVVAG